MKTKKTKEMIYTMWLDPQQKKMVDTALDWLNIMVFEIWLSDIPVQLRPSHMQQQYVYTICGRKGQLAGFDRRIENNLIYVVKKINKKQQTGVEV